MIPVAKPFLTEEEAQSAYDTILSGWVTQGPRVAAFEKAFATYVGSRDAVAVSSCTAALHLALRVAGVSEGDEVICPSMSFIATANPILYCGATPVFAEVLRDTYNIDPADAEGRITERTKAILIVHQVGMPAQIDVFRSMCVEHKLVLIEDAACAAGSSYRGAKIGCHSDLVCFSFHPRKVITTGDGGMVATSDGTYAERLRRLRQHGMSVNDQIRHESRTLILEEYLEPAYNYRMTDIQGAIGIQQLKKLDWLVEERRRIAARYNDAFSDIDCIELPVEPDGCRTNAQSYCVYVRAEAPLNRDQIVQAMLDQDIATRRGVMSIHKEPAYRDTHGHVSLPISEDLSANCIVLPLYVPMEGADIDRVITSFRELVLG